MKIGILTHHWVYNFGANLQALATQSALRAQGHDVVMINYRNPEKIDFYNRSVPEKQASEHHDFCKNYLEESELLTRADQVEAFCMDSLDGVVVGSDAVFMLMPGLDPMNILRKLKNPDFRSTKRLPPYWLPWKRNNSSRIVKASLAASAMGTYFFLLPLNIVLDIRASIEQFHYLSVRDRWTQLMIRLLSGGRITPELTPDPVFALNRYFKMPDHENPGMDLSDTILLSGPLDQDWVKAVIRKAHARGYRVANIPNPESSGTLPETDLEITLPLTPLQWFNCYQKAAGFIGVRFHGLVSCLANRTPAINVDHHKRSHLIKLSSKMYDLCLRAGIPERYTTLKQLHKLSPETALDILFNKQSQARADAYAKQAGAQFSRTITAIGSLISTHSKTDFFNKQPSTGCHGIESLQ